MKCGLCGHFGGLKNMVKECSIIKCNKETIKLKKKLNCRNYGIYAAECRLCPNYYVGQTKNKFSKRWTTHRSTWNKLINNNEWRKNNNKNKEITDEKALFHHFREHHRVKLGKDLKLSDAYQLIFLEEPDYNKLDIQESYWIDKLNAKINIAKTILPRYK